VVVVVGKFCGDDGGSGTGRVAAVEAVVVEGFCGWALGW
jgi:hypothetical protein